MGKILLLSPYWKEEHRWMVSSVKLADLWQRLGYSVTAVCMGPQTKVERISDTLTVHYRKDFFLPDPWNYGIALGFAGYVRRLVKKENPDIIVVNKLLFWSSLSIIPLRLTGRKVLLATDAFVGMTWWPRGWFPRVCSALYAWTLGWLLLLFASQVITFHPQPLRLLRLLGIARKTHVIPTGIDPVPFHHDHAHREGAIVTYIGRLESVKGVDDFLAAVVPLKKDYPHLKVQVVGWHKKGHSLVARYGGDVSFTGLRADIPAVLSTTEIFVLPSYSEGLSNALMEAMSSSCACIASDVGGNRFLIQNGVAGFLFPPGDREALRSHVRRLLDDPAKCRSLGKAARARIEEYFSWDAIGKQYGQFFQDFLAL
ncbi:hypothetical protein A2454_03120 [Candidatus Peribacteria bacterium RIFOXYC2_FULL_55_14]|nr:MAG: hypothetical protein A2198_01500 [Candidatus Peribacteria bacterium RIFOXYA1_FULL_56_14]OGJ73797.1 MAG: hypothetical protein A2384_04445 [Candidatus Peribacteria bacterium RIFOXYB1_FULL_54_35]OGJ74925.1 MAG: hypothetical protein A2217_02915 [Candidatus Peribacteria bacterium RIFOXYA2_FULL_55_28]OGJ77213.1 MAG: hypothetical protein A2327_06020 [Candidatus Peribacteria bacterium RIFOXYB2_FULL_54_17]OGJ79111.1 MAG: hypothetical protein A2424_02770 [Candidatus Peribacteria bacterium RIFOXYC